MALADQLESLSLPASGDQIDALDVGPEALEGLREATVDFAALTRLREVLRDFCSPAGLATEVRTEGELKGHAPYWERLRRLGACYSRICRSAAERDLEGTVDWCMQIGGEGAPKIGIEGSRERLEQAIAEGDGKKTEAAVQEMIVALACGQAWVQINAFEAYFLAIVVCDMVFGSNAEEVVLARLTIDPQTQALDGLATRIEKAQDYEGSLRELGLDQVTELLRYATSIHDKQAKRRAQTSEDGAFSKAWLEELSFLARRDPGLQQRYGAKQVERRFERHLALLFQTFGFGTVPALSGEAAADLLCIGRAASGRYSFLVDAKSSARAYALPLKDQRAIEDYVEETKGSLGDLPELRFLLLVGHGPGSTGSTRLHGLERKIGLPIRFIDARGLVELRQQIPGALRADAFLKWMLRCDPVVSSEAVAELTAKNSEPDEAIATLVRTLRQASA